MRDSQSVVSYGYMNRKIKFRAWDTEKNKWIYVSLGDLICGATSMPSAALGPNYRHADGDQSTAGEFKCWGEYTGLTDKTGKEIYEGDMVKHYAHKRQKWVIEYLAPKFEARNAKNGSVMALWHNGKLTDFKVIGNVFENPELLDAPKTE